MYKTIDKETRIKHLLEQADNYKAIKATEENRDLVIKLRTEVRNKLIMLGHSLN